MVSLDEILRARGLEPGTGLPVERWEEASGMAAERIRDPSWADRDLVLDDTLSRRFLRERYRGLAAATDRVPALIVLRAEEHELRRRIAENARIPRRPGINEDVLQAHLEGFEWPGEDELPVNLDAEERVEQWLTAIDQALEHRPRMIHWRGPETERTFLRSLRAEDAEAFFPLGSDPQIIRYTGDQPLQSVEDSRRLIARYLDYERYGFGRWVCFLKRERQLIGFAGLKHLHERGEVDLGYRFLPEHWGKGLATETSAACLEFGFETLGLDRIIALVEPENRASRRVAEKIGMRPVGIGALGAHAAVELALTKAEWRRRSARGH